jgi:hypothetical protein
MSSQKNDSRRALLAGMTEKGDAICHSGGSGQPTVGLPVPDVWVSGIFLLLSVTADL